MKTFIITIFLVAGAGLLLLIMLAALSRSGKPPGLVAGRLVTCPDKPNCVATEQGSDTGHYLAPVTLRETAGPDTLTTIRDVIVDMGGVIQAQQGEYMAASFSSPLFGFVDDFEIRVDQGEGLIHVRSASRVGYGDAGVNRKRVELFRKRYAETAAGE
ncbi:DUF1499 domain-containing protein [Gammaproteobacteria bacterium]|nr:DUF1499 domain-containing protein [Gammaproteobacteria bacterium]